MSFRVKTDESSSGSGGIMRINRLIPNAKRSEVNDLAIGFTHLFRILSRRHQGIILLTNPITPAKAGTPLYHALDGG